MNAKLPTFVSIDENASPSNAVFQMMQAAGFEMKDCFSTIENGDTVYTTVYKKGSTVIALRETFYATER